MIHKHEKIAFPYLQKLGYNISDIKINNGNGKPDITTICDGKEWEVKIWRKPSYPNCYHFHMSLDFTEAQINSFNNDVQILIYEKIDFLYKFMKRIKFSDIIGI